MARAALFDVGDTLLHWGSLRRERFVWLCEQAGISLPVDAASRLAGARAAERYFNANLDREDRWTTPWWTELLAAGLEESGLSGTLAAQVADFRTTQPTSWVLDPDALPVLAALRARDYRIGLVSNWDGTLATLCAEWGILDHVDYVGDSGVFGTAKPAAAFFHHVLDQLGVDPAAAFHVGDTYDADVAGAQAAGITSVLLDALTCDDRPCDYRITGLHELLPVVDRIELAHAGPRAAG
jgi:HAD superfamily hydrolase (TIGR01509 family)